MSGFCVVFRWFEREDDIRSLKEEFIGGRLPSATFCEWLNDAALSPELHIELMEWLAEAMTVDATATRLR
ncbi:MAG: hypothetical protein ACRDGF_06745 [Chloroflexota bacterium]